MIESFDRETILQKYSDLLIDESKSDGGIPSKVFFPENDFDLCAIMKQSEEEHARIRLIGNHTGTTGGSIPLDNEWAVSFSRMNRILGISRLSDGTMVMRCEPGISLQSIKQFLEAPKSWPYVKGQELLASDSYFYMPDPTETSAQLGGSVATNASGARSFRFGATRNSIHSLSLVTVSGETFTVTRGTEFNPHDGISIITDQQTVKRISPFTFNSPSIKNSSGLFSSSPMDLIDLFIGSEGILCAFSSVTIKLHRQMPFIGGCSFFTSRESAFRFAEFLRNDYQVASIEFFDESALEFIDRYRDRASAAFPDFPQESTQAILWEFIDRKPSLFESRFDSWESALGTCGSSFSQTWSGIEPEEIERLRRFRHALPETVNSVVASYKRSWPSIRKIGTDTALPADCFYEVYNKYLSLINDSRIGYAAFGHLGDYHIHINLLPSNAEELKRALEIYDLIMTITIENCGTISAEHGIGKLKKKYLEKMYGSEVIDQMKMIKKSFDPQLRLNCGVMIF